MVAGDLPGIWGFGGNLGVTDPVIKVDLLQMSPSSRANKFWKNPMTYHWEAGKVEVA